MACAMTKTTLITGRVLSFVDNPFQSSPDVAARWDDAILVDGAHIRALGTVADLADRADVRVDYPDHVICAGFVDAHVHYPQTAIIASWGKRLIDWLNTYTFPEETRFEDPAYAHEIAGRYLDLVLDHGTTSVASYCTIHPASVDAFFEAAQARGMAVSAGKTCMDRNAPDGLRDTVQSAYDDSKSLLERWNKTGRANYLITPRFAPTSTPEQLQALGALWAEYPDCHMQTHLSEQLDEIAWVRELFPQARDYLDVYETFGLLGQNGIYGHSIHLEPRERDRLAETGAAIAHCPTSNTFIGSGICDVAGLMKRGVTSGLATDTGGGSSFSMLRTMAAAYELAQLRGDVLHAAHLMYLATESAAKSLGRADDIGTLAPGSAADLVVLDLSSTPAIAQRSARANDVWEALFPTIMMGDDRAIADVWLAGQRRTTGTPVGPKP